MSDEPGKILYVDDDEGNRVVFDYAFNEELPVLLASSGAEALELMKQHEVAVVVTDQRMPGMSGNELLRLVKVQHPCVVRMVITAHSDLDAILGAVNDGLVARYVVKPWQVEALREILRWALDAWRLGVRSASLQARLLEVERIATVGTVASAIMHDINSPLSYLSLNTERIQQLSQTAETLEKKLRGASIADETAGLAAELAAELPALAAELAQGAGLMMDAVADMNRLLQNEASASPSADPLPAIRYSMRVCRDASYSARCRIGYDGPAELARVRISPASLSRVLINLVTNSAQAIADSGARGRVTVIASVDATHLRLQVSDDGPGMSDEVAKRASTPMFTTKENGIGLGVSQCLRLVEGANGSLVIDTKEGRGTTVQVLLPLADAG